jgi:hypothetical protein
VPAALSVPAASGAGGSASFTSRDARGAEIGQFGEQRKLAVTSDTYTHVLSDGREVDLVALLS